MNNKYILIVGGFGFKDIGDESMLSEAVQYFKTNFPRYGIKTLSINPEFTSTYHNIESYKSFRTFYIDSFLLKFFRKVKQIIKPKTDHNKVVREGASFNFTTELVHRLAFEIYFLKIKAFLYFNLPFLSKDEKKCIDLVKNAELIFNTGGGTINTRWGAFPGFGSQMLIYCTAKYFKKKTFFDFQTIGPFYKKDLFSRYDINLAQKCLPPDTIICVRDHNYSKNVVYKDLNLNIKVIEGVDPSFTLEMDYCFDCKKIIGDEYLNQVAFNLSSYDCCSNIGTKKELASFLDYIIQEKKYKVYGVSLVNDADLPAMLDVRNLMQQKDNFKIIKGDFNEKQLKALISQAKYAIGARYHFNIFSLTSNIPSIGIAANYYSQIKLRGIHNMMGDDFVVEPNAIMKDNLIGTFNKIECFDRKILQENFAKNKKLQHINKQVLKELLKNSNDGK